MGRFQFQLADADDDAALRRVLASTPMDGAIRIAFAREPSYFEAAEVDGEQVQVGIAQECATGRVVGMGSRAISHCYVNGQVQAVGYLSGLRLLPEFHGRAGLLARGYAFLRQLHQDGQADFYLTTIAEDNQPALRLLTGERAGLPVYHALGRYITLVMGRAKRGSLRSSSEIRTAVPEDRAAILDFLHDQGAKRQFFPAYRNRDLFSGSGRLKQLRCQDVLLAWQSGELVGTLGCWNQPFKQTIVTGYAPAMKYARPLFNTWAALRRTTRLPRANEQLPVTYGAIPVVRDDDPEIFQHLLAAAGPLRSSRRPSAFLLGFVESDPLLTVARKFAVREYATRLFLVYWPQQPPDFATLVRRVPYLELGCL